MKIDIYEKIIYYYWFRFKWNVIKDNNYYEFLDKYKKQIEDLGYKIQIHKNYISILDNKSYYRYKIDDSFIPEELLNKTTV